jgi:hypothetical protein
MYDLLENHASFQKLHTETRLYFCAIKTLYGLCKSVLYGPSTVDVPSSKFVPKLSQTPQNSFQNFMQSNTGLLLDLCASKMLYGHLEIRANCSSNFLGVLMDVRPPRKPCLFPKITHNNTPLFLCNKNAVRTV